MSSIEITVVGGPTAIIEIGGVRLLTDPTFDEPGDYDLGGRVLTKTTPPALTPGGVGVGEIDAVLLSHDQHPDNLDASGRRYLAAAERVFSTASAAARIPGVTAVPTWTTVDVPRPDGRALHVTAVPAQHGPDGSEPIVGEVTGFVLTGDGTPTAYVSGDNASLAVVDRRCGALRRRRPDALARRRLPDADECRCRAGCAHPRSGRGGAGACRRMGPLHAGPGQRRGRIPGGWRCRSSARTRGR